MPALPQLRTLTSYVARWAADLDALPRDAPVPRRMREQCVSLARDLVADPASVGMIIHGDLHYQNVLAADREPWLVIDPKPMSGDPHYEPAPMLWNRLDEHRDGDVRDGLRRRFHALVDAGGPRRGPRPRLGRRPDGAERRVGRHRRRPRPGLADHVRGDRQGGAGLSDRPSARSCTSRRAGTGSTTPTGWSSTTAAGTCSSSTTRTATDWGDMSWGHAVSTDLVTWDERPVAIARTSTPTGGRSRRLLGLGRRHDGDDLVAVYTYVARPPTRTLPGSRPSTWRAAATAARRGSRTPPTRCWTAARPTSATRRSSGDGDRWLMVAVEAVQQLVVIYASDDLHALDAAERVCRPGGAGRSVGVPRPVPARRRRRPDEVRWVLLLSVLTGAPGGGSGMRWWLGDFDGTTFTPEHSDWLDHGRDCYAAVTWNDAPTAAGS